MPYAHCEACGRSQYECLCRATCAECGIRTNHTTAQHLYAQRVMCRECDVVEVHDEDRLCPECIQDEWAWREDEYYDALSKTDEGGEQ